MVNVGSMSDDGNAVIATNFLDDYIVRGNIFNIGLLQAFTAATSIYFTSAVKPGESLDAIFLLPISLSPVEGYVTINIYEDTEYTGGTAVSIGNRNRLSENESVLDVLAGATGTVKGTLLPFSHVFGTDSTPQSSGGGSGQTSNSIILDPGKKYLYELTASESNIVGINAEFGEI